MTDLNKEFREGTEQWQDSVGYEGYYRVSNKGRVKRLQGFGCSKERILKLYTNRQNRYTCVTLSKRGISPKTYYVHQLVLEAFVGPKPSGHETRHLDGSKNNSSLNNLVYGTHSENMKDRTNHGRHFQPKIDNCGSKHGLSKLTDSNIREIQRMLMSGRVGNSGRKYSQQEIATIFGVHQVTISKIKLGKLWRHLSEEVVL
jgi:hypothetical protein